MTTLDEEIKRQRGGEKGTLPRYRCAHAEQSVEENLQKFRDMRDGKYKPKEAFLRMKQDVSEKRIKVFSQAFSSTNAFRLPMAIPRCGILLRTAFWTSLITGLVQNGGSIPPMTLRVGASQIAVFVRFSG
jgi:tRNA synthetases class I (E and Q), catalytic domain.